MTLALLFQFIDLLKIKFFFTKSKATTPKLPKQLANFYCCFKTHPQSSLYFIDVVESIISEEEEENLLFSSLSLNTTGES